MKNNKIAVACTSLKFLTIRISYMGFPPTLLLCLMLYMSANVYGQAAIMPENQCAGSSNNTLPVDRLAGISTSSQVLPVNYGPISATVSDGILIVSWLTTFETNNKAFVIEGSLDGIYWKKIGTVISSAKNGNSDKPLKYSLEIVITEIAVAGFSAISIFLMAMIMLALFPITKKIRLSASITFVTLLTCLAFASCKKTDMPVADDKRLAKFIRIGQIDADNITYYSKVIKMVTR